MKKPVVLVLFVVALMVSAWGLKRATTDDSPPNLVIDRVWLDHLPSSSRDTVQAFFVMRNPAGGGFQAASAWRGHFELFAHGWSGGKLGVYYPHTGEREEVTTRARRCNENGMDYCLDIEGASRGVKRYYSRKGWEIEGHDAAAVQRQVDELHAQLTAAAARR